MPGKRRTPERGDRRPRDGSRFLSGVLADNIRLLRAKDRLTQDDLAERMQHLGHGWVRATVSEVERRGRVVTVDELLGLALVFGVTLGDLLDPTGIDGRGREGLDLGPWDDPLPAQPARVWVRQKATFELRFHDDGSRDLRFLPAPADPVSYDTAALVWMAERTGGRIKYAPGNEEGAE